jgi:hypothetical protein
LPPAAAAAAAASPSASPIHFPLSAVSVGKIRARAEVTGGADILLDGLVEAEVGWYNLKPAINCTVPHSKSKRDACLSDHTLRDPCLHAPVFCASNYNSTNYI